MANAARFLFPFLIVLFALYLFSSSPAFNEKLLRPTLKAASTPGPFDFIINFNDDPGLEDQFLRNDSVRPVIFLLGSSELVNNSDAVPYRFIKKHFRTQVKAVGHAGNQCFSMFSQLLANSDRLPDARIVFIISPGWFESKNALGTSSEVFLEYNSERFLQKILDKESSDNFRIYASRRIAEMYPEFNSPSLPLKLLNFEGRASKSPLHKAVYLPLIAADNFLLKAKKRLLPDLISGPLAENASYKPVAEIPIAWDSLLQHAKSKASVASTNNTLGINNAYYTQHIHGRTGSIEPVGVSCNQEFMDFKMLVKLAKEYHVQASFLISPLNPIYYKNLAALNPVLDSVKKEITAAGFSYLDLFTTDASRYEKATLTDIMHMGDYGWYLTDRFIIDRYHLADEK
jgi:D-alanine transfer protein